MTLRTGLGVGLILAVLLSLALFLFGLLTPYQTVSAIFLLSGSWTLTFGVFLGAKEDKMTYSGWGVAVALLSTFIFLPLQYTAGLVILGIVAVILVWILARSRNNTPSRAVASSVASQMAIP